MHFIFVLDLGEAVSGMAVDDHISDPEEEEEREQALQTEVKVEKVMTLCVFIFIHTTNTV
jgi:hypothetical protein